MSDKNVVASIRMSEENREKFKELMEQMGTNQAGLVETLISTYELNQSKVSLVSRETEIEEMEHHIKRVMDIYLNSLEINKNQESIVKEKYIKKMEEDKKVIEDLRKEIVELKDFKEHAIEQYKEQKELYVNEVKRASALIKTIEDKENIIRKLEAEVLEVKELKEENKTLNNRLKSTLDAGNKLGEDIRRLEKENMTLTNEIEKLKSSMENKDKAHKDEMIAVDKAHKDEIEKLNMKHNAEIEKLKFSMENEKTKAELELNKLEFSKSMRIGELENVLNKVNDQLHAYKTNYELVVVEVEELRKREVDKNKK